MFDEIEQFIRKAAQAAQEAAEKARAEQEGKRRPPQQPRPQRPPQKRPPQQPARQPPRVLEATVIENPHELADRALPPGRLTSISGEHLAQEVELADDKMQAHVEGVFEHKLGRLQQTAAEPQVVNTAGIDLIAKMLSNPRDLRNAIILSEIMKRPEHF